MTEPDKPAPGPAEPSATAGAEATASGEPRRRRRRRRRGGQGGAEPRDGSETSDAGDGDGGEASDAGSDAGEGDGGRAAEREPAAAAAGPAAAPARGLREGRRARAGRAGDGREGRPAEPRGARPQERPGGRDRRDARPPRAQEPRGSRPQLEGRPQEPRGPRAQERASREGRRREGEPLERSAERPDGRRARHEPRDDQRGAAAAEAPSAPTYAAALPRLGATARAAETWDPDDDDAVGAEPKQDWGKEDDSPAPTIALRSPWPDDLDDLDPATRELDELDEARPARGDVVTVAGVRFGPAGRILWFDCQAAWYAAGDRVLVDSERGPRLATVVVDSERRQGAERGNRRILRLANAAELAREQPSQERSRAVLRLAKDRVAALDLPVKVFRVETSGGGRNERLMIYLTTDERVELRELIRDLSSATGARVELRQLGARDEAKAIGGIGSCGLTLCCTTWLPEFVPVSIKMAKDQGLVLNPTKVAGQCGRLKCCLVYEQAGYAELRKGLPKLGKRVVTARGEGRVVEVDVLRQRVRVSYGPGESEVLPASEMRPLFPSGNSPPSGRRGDDSAASADDRPDPSRDPSAEPSIDEDLEEDAAGDIRRLEDSPAPSDDPPSEADPIPS